MKRLFLWLSGANPEVLKRCPSESFKQAALGGTVATTSLLAAFSAYSIGHQFLHLPTAVNVLAAVFWGVAIMNLDRWLLATLSRQSSRRDTLLIALPRAFLAILVGLVVSLVVMLEVFHSEVTRQAVSDVQRTAAVEREQREKNYAQIPVLQAEKSSIQERLASFTAGEALETNTFYQRMIRRLATLEGELDKAEKTLISLVGSPEYAVQKERVERIKFRTEQTRLAAQKQKTRLLRQEAREKAKQDAADRQRVKVVNAELAALTNEKSADKRQFDEAVKSAPSQIRLLDRIKALWSLAIQNFAVMMGLIIGGLIILTLDALPVGAKVLLLLTPTPSLYDRTLVEFENEEFDVFEKEVEAVSERRRLARQAEHDKVQHEYETQKIELEAKSAMQRTDHEITIEKAAAQVQAEKDALEVAAKVRAVQHGQQVSEAEDKAEAEAKVRTFRYEVVVDEAKVQAEFEKEAITRVARKIVAAQEQALDKWIDAIGEMAEASVEAQIEALKQSAPDAETDAQSAAGSQTGSGSTAGP